jgi:hypothetical protein
MEDQRGLSHRSRPGSEHKAARGDLVEMASTLSELDDSVRKVDDKHKWDPNMPTDPLEEACSADVRGTVVDNVPYAETRAAVRDVGHISE